MSNQIATAVVAGASALGGGTIVAGSNYVISRAQSRDAGRSDLRKTLVSLLSVLIQVDQEFNSEPRTKRAVRVVNEQMESRFPQIDYVTGRVHRRLFQPHLDGLLTRLADALASTELIAPKELLEPLATVSRLMENADPHDTSWAVAWQEARSVLVVRCRHVLGPDKV